MRYAYLPSAIAVIVFVGLGPARAACYEDVGCTDTDRFSSRHLQQLASCQVLWEMRNSIFKENGYCFRTGRAIEVFGNAGCQYDDVDGVPLSNIERANIEAIKRAETRKGC